MKKFLSLGLVLAFGSSAFAQELVTNGNFATATESGWTLQAASSGTDQGIGSVSGDPGNADYASSSFGWYGAAVSTNDDVIYQTLATNVGQTYTLLVNYETFNTSESGMDIWWNTSTFTTGAGNVYSATDPGVNGTWEQLSFQVTATSSSTLVAVGAYNIPSAIYLTDIGVTPSSAPEPASMAVLGLSALALIRRRRNRS
jgi:MYXO-CTERM domain-containing protein